MQGDKASSTCNKNTAFTGQPTRKALDLIDHAVRFEDTAATRVEPHVRITDTRGDQLGNGRAERRSAILPTVDVTIDTDLGATVERLRSDVEEALPWHNGSESGTPGNPRQIEIPDWGYHSPPAWGNSRARDICPATFVAMAKTEQRKLARTLFVEHGRNRKQIAEKLNVQEKTVGSWASEGNWDALRAEYVGRQDNVIRNLKQLVNKKTEMILAEEAKTGADADPDILGKLYDQLSKASKALDIARGENDITLSVRVRVMEWVFGEMQTSNPKEYANLVDFQEALLEKAAALHA